MFMLAGIVIVVVFVAATIVALAALVYLVTLTVRERHLSPGVVIPTERVARDAVSAERRATGAQAGTALAHHR